MLRRLRPSTRRLVSDIFDRLDYRTLGRVYCDEGGDAFWRARRRSCQRLGLKLAEVLLNRLVPGGASLYVGAGVFEIPLLVMETVELGRNVEACTLRRREVQVLNRACRGLPFRLRARNAMTSTRRVDHLWIVSVLNDPEEFPHLSALSYGRAHPLLFDPLAFARERTVAGRLAKHCLGALQRPAWVTTSVEEVFWITEWAEQNHLAYTLGKQYPTAIVQDPVCMVRIGDRQRRN